MPSFSVQHAAAARSIKGEDAFKAIPILQGEQLQGHLFVLCDGHAGVQAANYVIDNFLRILQAQLPEHVFVAVQEEDYKTVACDVLKAMCEAFVLTDNGWLQTRPQMAGTTVTIALLLGRLLTCANVGDSEAVLDTGCSILPLTHSHRLQTNLQEQARLRKAGCEVAPYGFHLQGPAKPDEQGVGPLRVWPSGLCVSRSIGDSDAGPEVVPMPHVKQVLVPDSGCRFMLASDGLWDVFKEFSKAVRLVRGFGVQDAASELVRIASLNNRVIDDTSVIVVDVLPSGTAAFPAVVQTMPQGPRASGGMCACFQAETSEQDSRDAAGPGHLDYLSDVDGLSLYPKLKDSLRRNSPYVKFRNGKVVGKGGGQGRTTVVAAAVAIEISEKEVVLQQGNVTVHSGQGISQSPAGPGGKSEIQSGISEPV